VQSLSVARTSAVGATGGWSAAATGGRSTGRGCAARAESILRPWVRAHSTERHERCGRVDKDEHETSSSMQRADRVNGPSPSVVAARIIVVGPPWYTYKSQESKSII
jgi:hypothetical protein